jgi:hypothetical protein
LLLLWLTKYATTRAAEYTTCLWLLRLWLRLWLLWLLLLLIAERAKAGGRCATLSGLTENRWFSSRVETLQ